MYCLQLSGEITVYQVFSIITTLSPTLCQGSAAGAFPDDHADHGNPQAEHFIDVACDGFALSAFFGFQARIGAGRIDEG